MAKRTRNEIAYRILKSVAVGNGLNWTRLIAKANLSHDLGIKYLDIMIDQGYVVEIEKQNGKSKHKKIIYSVTDYGYNFINDYEHFQERHKVFLEKLYT
jgi:predicted transcriptional regulator